MSQQQAVTTDLLAPEWFHYQQAQYGEMFNQKENAMPKISDMVVSKYLKTADVPDPVIVTIRGVKKVNIAKEDDAPEHKWIIGFQEYEKPMVLNSTNLHVAAKVLSSDDTDDWKGKEIILFTDPNVSFKGEVVGGLRFRGQEKAPVKAEPRRLVSSGPGKADFDDDAPF